MTPTHNRLIDLTSPFEKPLQRRLVSLIERPLSRMLSIHSVNRAYEHFSSCYDDSNFFDRALEFLNIIYEVQDGDLDKIPTEGPVLAVANHPFGGIDGIVMGSILTSVRSDVKLLANYLLGRVSEIRPWLISVDPFGGRGAATSNISGIKETIGWLRRGGLVGTFPSGTVSHFQMKERCVTDPEWSGHTAALIRRTRATTVPIFFDGRNSALFQVMGCLSPRLRTALLPHELMNKAGAELRVRIGKPIPCEKLARFDSDREIMDFLRLQTYIQKNRTETRGFIAFSPGSGAASQEELAEPSVETATLQREVENLPAEHHLLEQGEFSVYYARAWQIPNVMKEIGRLREITFREVGEGTGRSLDLDCFDRYYDQLFLWSRTAGEIAGAYRIGKTDRIISRFGTSGLYTNRLFQYKPAFFDQLGPALEMGRSFICSEYQLKRNALALLWKGIGAYVVRNPRYHILFGPVSISREYNPLSRNLMVQFLKEKRHHDSFARLVRAKNPPAKARLQGVNKKKLMASLRDIDDVSALVSEIERDSKGIPVLLRHYVKLNGLLLSFNVDKEFSQVLDGLIVVDLLTTDNRLLKRYLGSEGSASFLEYHGV